MLQKYSEDEPRDESGKWTSGGNYSGTLYHGTYAADLIQEHGFKLGNNSSYASGYGHGVYLTDDLDVAREYGDKVVKVDSSGVGNIKTMDLEQFDKFESSSKVTKLAAQIHKDNPSYYSDGTENMDRSVNLAITSVLQSQGYGGLHLTGTPIGDMLIAFDPKSLKVSGVTKKVSDRDWYYVIPEKKKPVKKGFSEDQPRDQNGRFASEGDSKNEHNAREAEGARETASEHQRMAAIHREEADKPNQGYSFARAHQNAADLHRQAATQYRQAATHYESGNTKAGDRVSAHADRTASAAWKQGARLGPSYSKASKGSMMKNAAVLTSLIEKIGAKHSKGDQALLNAAHDATSAAVGGINCCAMQSDAWKAAKADLEKRGARHSAATLALVKVAHDALCEAGAVCPGRDTVEKED